MGKRQAPRLSGNRIGTAEKSGAGRLRRGGAEPWGNRRRGRAGPAPAAHWPRSPRRARAAGEATRPRSRRGCRSRHAAPDRADSRYGPGCHETRPHAIPRHGPPDDLCHRTKQTGTKQTGTNEDAEHWPDDGRARRHRRTAPSCRRRGRAGSEPGQEGLPPPSRHLNRVCSSDCASRGKVCTNYTTEQANRLLRRASTDSRRLERLSIKRDRKAL